MKLRLCERIWDLNILASRLLAPGAVAQWEKRSAGSLVMYVLEALLLVPTALLVAIALGLNTIPVVEAPRWALLALGAVWIALNDFVIFRKARWEIHWERWARMTPGERKARTIISAAVVAALVIFLAMVQPVLRKGIYPG